MPLSNNSDAVVRFWCNYRNLLKNSGVKGAAAKWHVRHAEAYIDAADGRRLATHSVTDVEARLGDLGRIGGMPAWQFAQAVDAVRHLFLLARSPVVEGVDWAYWREGARSLPVDHPTVARGAPQPAAVDVAADGGTTAAAMTSQLIAVIRQRNYSIRTEQAYRGWLERFMRFINGADPRTAGAAEVKRFLQALAVEGRVAASTQNQALNALVFFYDKVLERPLGDLGNFARAKKPRRLPVVLSRSEVARLLACLDGVRGTMASLLYDLKAAVRIAGHTAASTAGVPQGGPLSPVLSNVVLDELDWELELERRGHRFVPQLANEADDCNIFVRSKTAGERVMKSVTRFLEDSLRLKVNTR